MEKCFKHRKDVVGSCMWCGKRMCQQCVAFQQGKKIYCEECKIKLNILE